MKDYDFMAQFNEDIKRSQEELIARKIRRIAHNMYYRLIPRHLEVARLLEMIADGYRDEALVQAYFNKLQEMGYRLVIEYPKQPTNFEHSHELHAYTVKVDIHVKVLLFELLESE